MLHCRNSSLRSSPRLLCILCINGKTLRPQTKRDADGWHRCENLPPFRIELRYHDNICHHVYDWEQSEAISFCVGIDFVFDDKVLDVAGPISEAWVFTLTWPSNNPPIVSNISQRYHFCYLISYIHSILVTFYLAFITYNHLWKVWGRQRSQHQSLFQEITMPEDRQTFVSTIISSSLVEMMF